MSIFGFSLALDQESSLRRFVAKETTQSSFTEHTVEPKNRLNKLRSCSDQDKKWHRYCNILDVLNS